MGPKHTKIPYLHIHVYRCSRCTFIEYYSQADLQKLVEWAAFHAHQGALDVTGQGETL